MKIAFVIYPGMNLIDLQNLYEPLLQTAIAGRKPRDLIVKFCCYETPTASLKTTLKMFSIFPIVTPSLEEYDLIVIVGSNILPLVKDPEFAANFFNWLGTIRSDAIRILTENAVVMPVNHKAFVASRKTPQPYILLARNHAEVQALSLKLCELAVGKEISSQVAVLMGYPPEPVERVLSAPRQARISRKTKETSINLNLALDGSGKNDISTGIPFFDHMLTQIAVHGLFDLSIKCQGDLEVDPHHTVEDVALALGKAFDEALGDRKGLVRMSSATIPMDESLAQVTLDFSGRPYAVIEVDWNDLKVGDLPTTLITHFLESFAVQARCNLSVRLLSGGDDHHRAEAIFKALARALDAATQIDPRRLNAIPSSKGVI